MKQINIEIENNTRAKLKSMSIENGITLKELVNNIFNEFFSGVNNSNNSSESSFDADKFIENVLKFAVEKDKDNSLLITGNFKKYFKEAIEKAIEKEINNEEIEV